MHKIEKKHIGHIKAIQFVKNQQFIILTTYGAEFWALEAVTILNMTGKPREGDSQLVTRSTRHKEAVNSSQANIKAVLPQQYNYPYP